MSRDSAPNAKQATEIISLRAWVEPSVWTDRMLNALVKGVKGGLWYSLIDKVWDTDNLKSAFQSVKANKGAPGVDNVSIKDFERHLEHNLLTMQNEIRNGTHKPKPVKRMYIDKPGGGKRPLGIPCVRDRVAQKALCNVLEPIFEMEFSPDSYGFRPGRGCKDALREVDRELRNGRLYVVDADIKGYFDTIKHDKLMGEIASRIGDGRVLGMIESYLKQDIIDEMKRWTPEEGTPQGSVLSPLMANLYLNGLDWMLKERAVRIVRYADDFVILCRTMEEAETALSTVREWCGEKGLTLHPDKTRIVDMSERGAYFDFLGYRFKRSIRKGQLIKLVRPKSEKALKDKVRAMTRRSNGRSMRDIVGNLNPTLNGWLEYFKHAHRTVFDTIDGWIRMRLRSIIKKREKRHGRGNGLYHFKYPNAYFNRIGLMSLDQTRRCMVQSLRSSQTGEPYAGNPHVRF